MGFGVLGFWGCDGWVFECGGFWFEVQGLGLGMISQGDWCGVWLIGGVGGGGRGAPHVRNKEGEREPAPNRNEKKD
jgi:hypothetical protein